MELKDYTTKELREELKRRATEARANAVREKPKYIELEAKIKNIHPCNYSKSFTQTLYNVSIIDKESEVYDIIFNCKLKNGCFRKDNTPKIGDTVIVSHLLTKARNSFNPNAAKIIRVVKCKEE